MIRTVGEEIDRLETEMKALVPGLVFVDLETDKGRLGVERLTKEEAAAMAARAQQEAVTTISGGWQA